MATLERNLEKVHQRIAAAARRAGRRPEEITLVAVTKTVPAPLVQAALDRGVTHIGENRVQEARDKLPQLQGPFTAHLIGHLQRNKVKYAVRLFDMIQSVDSLALAEEIDRRCQRENRTIPVLIEVNTSGEASKFGCRPQEALQLLRAMDRLPNLRVQGFMTIALFSKDLEQVRPCFKLLHSIYQEAQTIPLQHGKISVLSMGMSSDFEVAIEEGATMVRIGSAIFGPRPAP
ncbi:MAG: YggS family pyridoxal phosphate-dependent enzyme [Calditrichaeota bacterium]|nr:MAG: YggS family pyridoxal phosphate-dependent enzyme [Calditrichota bacterium]